MIHAYRRRYHLSVRLESPEIFPAHHSKESVKEEGDGVEKP
jgi:hypothetical protein